MSEAHDSASRSRPPRRWSLLLLIIPVILYALTPVVANSVEPRLFGLPFIVTYTIVVTILTWLFVWMAARGDRFYRGDLPEHIPSDVAFGEDYAIDPLSGDRPATDAPRSDDEEADK